MSATDKIIVFPLDRRVGKVRDVAGKMLAKSTDRHAAFYQDQVSAALDGQLQRLSLCKVDRDEQLKEFWQLVQAEMLRRLRCGSRPGGASPEYLRLHGGAEEEFPF